MPADERPSLGYKDWERTFRVGFQGCVSVADISALCDDNSGKTEHISRPWVMEGHQLSCNGDRTSVGKDISTEVSRLCLGQGCHRLSCGSKTIILF